MKPINASGLKSEIKLTAVWFMNFNSRHPQADNPTINNMNELNLITGAQFNCCSWFHFIQFSLISANQT